MKSTTYKNIKSFGISTISLALLLALSGCNGDDGMDGASGSPGMDGTDGTNGSDGENGAPGFPSANYILSNNGMDNAGTTDLLDQNAAALKRFSSGNNEGVALSPLGQLVHAGDSNLANLRTICNITDREDGTAFDPNIDRELTGTMTGLVNPKGIHRSEKMGLTFVADFTGMQVGIYGNQAAGNVAPVATTMTDAMPWDLVYDDVNDRLYVALTDGRVSVYDNYVESDFAAMPARTITPSDNSGAKISVNIHGIAYDKTANKLVLSDVGSASDATDGSIFVINNASSATGNVSVSRSIAGPNSMLGNPVDIALSGTDLRVAEKSNNAILVFSNIFSGASGDITPDLVTATTAPESLVEVSASFNGVDVSDSVNSAIPILSVAVSSNPASAGDTSSMVASFNAALTSQLGSYNTALTQESLTFDAVGNSYATYDGDEVGVLVSTKVATQRSDDAFSASYDRKITGDATGLVSPKGLDVASQSGLIFVAENNATTPAILIYSACASGNVMPLMTLTATGAARPWDVDYDAHTDRAFVALTNGTVAVFNEVVASLNAGETSLDSESQLITPAIAGVALPAPSNIHGIDYDSLSDALIISDVGSAADITDGKIYVLNNAGTASGLTDIAVNIAGPNTNLGNPVDIMYTGTDLYVAEKSNGLVMRFDNILSNAGGDISPDLSISYTAPESVAIAVASMKTE